MLKRSATIFLLVLYTITVSGFALNLHYCFNQLASVQIDAPAKGCVNGPETRKMNCCKDKHFVVKVKDAHQNSSSLFSAKVFVALLPKPALPDFTIAAEEAALAQSAYRGPPLSPPVSAYLMNCNIRI
jgi:hypothetical protein